MLYGPKSTQGLARRLRREMSLPERLLWRALQKRPANLRFRKQHPAGPYVLDFFCPSKRLAIEIDGEAHGRGDRPQRDVERDAWVAARGVRTLRIAATDVLNDLYAVILFVVTIAVPGARYPSTASGGPPPPPGED